MSVTVTAESFSEAVERNIRVLLALKGKSHAELATESGITETKLSQRLNGHSRWLALELRQVAAALGVAVDLLLAVDEDEFRELLRNRCEASFALVSDLPVAVNPNQGVLALAS